MDLRDTVANTRHELNFQIEPSEATVSKLLHSDKEQLREHILALRAQGMSYREIGRKVGLHWTRVGQILKGTSE